MYVVTVRFTLAPGSAEAFMPLIFAQAKNSLELEPECHQFDVCVDPADPAMVFLYEIYGDEAAFHVHLASDHFKQFDAAVADFVSDKHVACFHRSYPS